MKRTISWLAMMALATCSSGQPPPPTSALLDRTGSTARAPIVDVPRAGCVTTECHPGVKSKPFLHGPVRVNGCDGCHTLTDAAQHKFTPVRSREQLCALCHAPQAHANAVVHEPFAKGECLSCHDPHGSSERKILRGERYADSCSACHADVTAGHDRVHGPAAVGACGACHAPHSSPLPKLLLATGRDLCLKCHISTALELESKRIVHAPLLGDCGVCHDPHATDTRGLLVDDPGPLCLSCHADIAHTIDTATTQHAAVSVKRACINCHAPHASNHAALLRKEPAQLCFECHNQPIVMPDGSRLTNMKQLIETRTSLHGAVTQRGCIECHEIHGGGHRRLLVKEYPSELYLPFSDSGYALCFNCHDKQLVLEKTTNSATGFRNGSTNLHALHVNDGNKGRSCKVCHDSHAASRAQHIRENVPFGAAGWKLPINYKPLPMGGSCGGGCHAPFEYNRETPILYPGKPAGERWKGEDLAPGSLGPRPGTAPTPPK